MASLSPFIRKTSPGMRRALSEALGLSLPVESDWTDSSLAFAKSMVAAAEAAQDTDGALAVTVLERISSMADDVGDIAMESVCREQNESPDLGSVQDRAIWLFINRPMVFKQAEEVRFIDDRRRTRRWDGFVSDRNLTLLETADRKSEFVSSLNGKISTGKVQVDIFQRRRRGFDGSEYQVWQVTIYAEQKLEVALEFRGETIQSIPRRPVLAAALTYEPQSGTVEVAASTKDIRHALATSFVKALLSSKTAVAQMTLRRYDLQSLKRPHAFPTDPVDRIKQVMLRSLRLMPFGAEEFRLTMELGRASQKSIWDFAEARFGDKSPLRAGWLVTSATVAVTFQPDGSSGRGKTISVQITEPNGCDLKDRTELEQLIANKYLQLWGLLSDEPELLED